MTPGAGFRRWGAHVSNWGRWGREDRLGTLNLIRPGHRAAAGRLIVTGEVVPLGLEFNADGPQPTGGLRPNTQHVMTRTGAAEPAVGGFQYTDDLVLMHTQCATQIDGLAHVAYDGLLYNGHPVSTVTTDGAAVLGVEGFRSGIQGRGVLADLPRHLGVERLLPEQEIGRATLESCLDAQGVEVAAGDIVLIRTGWMQVFLVDGDRAGYLSTEPGIGLDTTAWLHERGVSFLASDNWAVEVVPAGLREEDMPVHCVLVRDMGMPLGEMFDLEALADHCARTARWEFWFSCHPLPITGGVGSPVAPVATF
ncbi:MAG TPA: cyclase family protein [Modestobacter sp.]|nr:cyclase family protein [Modestobacter sp.]